jgi:hypothetical protein
MFGMIPLLGKTPLGGRRILILHPMTFYQRVVMELEYRSDSAAVISLISTGK